MSKSNVWENDYLRLLFQNVAATNIGDAGGLRGSVTAGNLFLSLHTSDPGETGTQETNEVAYTSYARASVARSSAGFTVTDNQVTLAADVPFPTCTGGTATVTHFAIGTAASGAGRILYRGALSSSLAISNNVRPELTTGVTVTED